MYLPRPQRPSLPRFLRMCYRMARRKITGMYWFDSRSPPVLIGFSGTRSGWGDGHCWDTSPGHHAAHEPDTACRHCWTKGAQCESRSKQCDCISRLMQLIPEARVNCLIQCIISVQADPWAGIVSHGALLQCAASATVCPRAWLQIALRFSTSFWELLCTNFEGQNSGCFRPFGAFITLSLPRLLDLWSTLLTFKDLKGHISSDLASISLAVIFGNKSLSAYSLSLLFNQYVSCWSQPLPASQ